MTVVLVVLFVLACCLLRRCLTKGMSDYRARPRWIEGEYRDG